MADLHLMKMSDTADDAFHRRLMVKERRELRLLLWPLNEVRQRGGTELKRYEQPGILALLIKVANNIRMRVRGLKEGDLVRGESGEVGEEPLDSDGTGLEGA